MHMGYSYETERPKLFTEDGQVMLLKIRDNVQRLLKEAGAVRADRAIESVGGDSWLMLACLDRLVELGEIRRVSEGTCGQHQVFVGARGEWSVRLSSSRQVPGGRTMTFDERSTKLLRALVIAWDVDDGEEADDVLRACRRHLGLVLRDDQRSHEEQLAAILEADE